MLSVLVSLRVQDLRADLRGIRSLLDDVLAITKKGLSFLVIVFWDDILDTVP